MAATLSARRMLPFVPVVLGLLGLSSVVVVDEGHQAVIERMGEPVRVINRFRPDKSDGAGVVLKIPLFERAVWLERGLQGYSVAGTQVRTADEQVLLVDADVTYRIIDPVRLLQKLGQADKIDGQFKAILPGLLGAKLVQRSALEIATPGSGGAGREVLATLDAKARDFGVQVVDLRVGRVGLPDAGLSQVFQRMKDRRELEAKTIDEQSSREASLVVARTQAEVAAIMQVSAGQDPEFYGFLKAMRNYELLYGDPERKNAATIVIPPDSAYLKHFNGR
jgi:membrane protease subunit HflC